MTIEVETSTLEPAPTPTATTTPASGVWEGNDTLGAVFYWTSRDEITDDLSTFVSVPTTYTDSYGLEQDAALTITCSQSRRSVWLSTDEYHSGDQESVSYRIDSGRARSERWDIFGSLNRAVTPALLSASTRDAFINRLRDGETLRIRTTETPTLTFNISQLFDTPAQVNIDACR